MKNPWQKLSSRIAYKNPWITVREDQVIKPDGTEGIYGVVESDPAVFVIAKTNEGKIYFVDVFRYTLGHSSLELPAGGTDGEDPVTAAKRELKEETGLIAMRWQLLGQLDVHNGVSSQSMYAFLATELTQTNEHGQKDDGISKVVLLDTKQITNHIKNGRIRDTESLAALLISQPHTGLRLV